MVPEGPPETQLTACFTSNAKPQHAFGRHLLYTNYAERFTYHAQSKEWKVRESMLNTVIGHMYFVMPNAGEVYFLRLLLYPCPRFATSFEHLRTVNGH